MTSITNSIAMGRQMMDARITKAVSAGSISSADQTALDGALDKIDSALSSSSGASSGTDMKSKIDGLIQEQVSAGTLTSDQASELQGFFAPPGSGGQGGDTEIAAGTDLAVAGADGAQGTGDIQGTGGPQGMQGPPPPPPPSDAASSDTDAASGTDSASGTTTASADTSKLDTLIKFLETLRANVASGSGTYGGTTGASDASSAGALIDTAA